MVHYQILKISFFITLTVLAAGCSPSKFQTNTSSSVSRESVVIKTPETDLPIAPAPATETIPEKVANTCELHGKTKVQRGERVDFSVTTNFEIPKNTMTLLSGSSYGTEFTADAATSPALLGYGLEYQIDAQAGIHKRQIHMIDVNGKTLCSSKVLVIEFVGIVAADQSCQNIGGKIQGAERETCTVESWKFYREMSARSLVSIQTPTSTTGSLNMTNPSANYCDTVGVYGYDLAAGGIGVCRININSLHKLLTQ